MKNTKRRRKWESIEGEPIVRNILKGIYRRKGFQRMIGIRKVSEGDIAAAKGGQKDHRDSKGKK